MDKINAEMKEAEKHITGMEKWCGLCVCPWNRCDTFDSGNFKYSLFDLIYSKGILGLVNFLDPIYEMA